MYYTPFYLILLLSFFTLNSASAQLLGKEEQGKASFYNKMFDGRQTSSGEKFNQKELTAAHRSLPINTMIEVTNLSNNKSVIVRVNDRGPFHHTRLIDLTRAAAEHLGFIKSGIASVKLRVVGMEGMILLGQNEIITDTGDIIEKANKL
ncbi:septal ring lytic transglycosylase RlpA family lipoprotein [Runella rosea]|uniref:Probable endolytic peptidoglycan transglycosylase RlpA n=2 Tax=Runella rosea TaxID=2259595 RepID=A0A344TSW3_9BACT|nr:septal ring lytic transglycosylase RlpA family lipoprotein [Runella rosea]